MLRNLFTSSFNYIKKQKGIHWFLIVIVLLYLLCQIFNYLYVQTDEWSRKLWHDFYNEEGTIDNIYLGSSHVHRSIQPQLLDELNGENNFNLSTGLQRTNASYYMLKEAMRYNDIKHVYLEMYYYTHVSDYGNFDNIAAIRKSWQCTDWIKFSGNKIQAVCDMSTLEYWVETLFPFLRYRNYLMDRDFIRENWNRKMSDEYRTYQYCNEVEYMGKGYMKHTGTTRTVYSCERYSDEIYMGEDAKDYLRRIIELCQSNDIEITLFSAPIYELQMLSIDTYDQYIQEVNNIAAEYGVEYYDFNLCKEDAFPIQYSYYFSDPGHLNNTGAEEFTRFFNNIMCQTAKENEKFFYETYEEKIGFSDAKVYGLITEKKEDKKKDSILYYIASGPREGLEYKVYLYPNEGDGYLYQDFSENKEITVPSNEHGICKIFWRETGENEELQSIEITY